MPRPAAPRVPQRVLDLAGLPRADPNWMADRLLAIVAVHAKPDEPDDGLADPLTNPSRS